MEYLLIKGVSSYLDFFSFLFLSQILAMTSEPRILNKEGGFSFLDLRLTILAL